MSEYIIEWSGIGARITELVGSETPCLAVKHLREERLREEIVRCRDCAKADYAEVHMFDGTRPRKWTCTRFGCFHYMVKPDDFCSRGARREL